MSDGHMRVTVVIIDDDESVRRALVRLFHSADMNAISFTSVDEFLGKTPVSERACVIADIQMPGISALELPCLLREKHVSMPVIFLSARDGEEICTAAKQAGAAGFFHKPVDGQALIDVINWSLKNDTLRSDSRQ